MKESSAHAGASVGALVGYALATLANVPVPVVYPHLGIVAFTAIPGEPGIAWYGFLVWALVGGVIGAGLGRRLPRWRQAPRALWVLAALLLLVLAWHERGWFA